jgi:hypothetical protein
MRLHAEFDSLDARKEFFDGGADQRIVVSDEAFHGRRLKSLEDRSSSRSLISSIHSRISSIVV